MIAYKLFELHDKKLYPWYPSIKAIFHYYDPKYIITRAEGCGPFTCFETAEEAKLFAQDSGYWDVVHRVRIKKSKDICIWTNKEAKKTVLPLGTILADEFEILEQIK